MRTFNGLWFRCISIACFRPGVAKPDNRRTLGNNVLKLNKRCDRVLSFSSINFVLRCSRSTRSSMYPFAKRSTVALHHRTKSCWESGNLMDARAIDTLKVYHFVESSVSFAWLLLSGCVVILCHALSGNATTT